MALARAIFRRTTASALVWSALISGWTYLLTPTAALAAGPDVVTSSQEVVNHKTFQVDKVKIEAPPEAVWAILTNYADTPLVYSKVTSCRVVVDEGAKKLVAFKVKAFKDLVTLDYTLNIYEHFPTSIEWSRNCGAFKSNEGYWHLEPADAGKTCLVTYAKFVDGGGIPQFFVVRELKTDMPVILASVKTSAELFYQNTLHERIAKNLAERTHYSSSTLSGKVPATGVERIVEQTTITLHGAPKNGL